MPSKPHLNLGISPETPKHVGPPSHVSFLYHSHKGIREREWYGSSLGPMSLGIPGISLEPCEQCFKKRGWLEYLREWYYPFNYIGIIVNIIRYNKPTNKDPY